MAKKTEWCVFDIKAESSVGKWNSYKYATTFMLDNADDNDNWVVIPAIEMIEKAPLK